MISKPFTVLWKHWTTIFRSTTKNVVITATCTEQAVMQDVMQVELTELQIMRKFTLKLLEVWGIKMKTWMKSRCVNNLAPQSVGHIIDEWYCISISLHSPNYFCFW